MTGRQNVKSGALAILQARDARSASAPLAARHLHFAFRVQVFPAQAESRVLPRRSAYRNKDILSTLEQSRAWTTFSFSGASVTVQITNNRPFTSARILPSHWKILPAIKRNVVSFAVSRPGQLAVDFCNSQDQCANDSEWDISNPMLVFSNPPQGRPQGHYLTASPGEVAAPDCVPKFATGR
jgi:hypothetical protein